MKSSRRRVAAAAVLGLTGGLLLAGCSSGQFSLGSASSAPAASASASASSPSSAHGGGGGGACSLVTQQEAAAALGTDAGPGVENSQGIATTCTFGTPPTVLTVAFLPSGGKVAFDHALALEQGNALVTVDGVGDAAFGRFSGPIGAIEFHRGDALVSVLLENSGPVAPSQDEMTALGKTVAGRL